MKYALLVYVDEKVTQGMSEDEGKALFAGYMELTEQLKASGKLIAGDALQPAGSATSLRVKNGKRLVTDGPFAETKEQLGGFYVVEAANLDEAMDWAAKVPDAKYGTIEVRPIWDFAGGGAA